MKSNANKKKAEDRCNIIEELSKCKEEKAEIEKDYRVANRKMSWIIIGTITQILVVIAICASVYYAGKNIELTRQNIQQQGEFNLNTLRPWVVLKLKDQIKILEDGRLRLKYQLENVGRYPAKNFRALTAITDTPIPAKDYFKQKIIEDNGGSVVFPQDKISTAKSNMIYICNAENKPIAITKAKTEIRLLEEPNYIQIRLSYDVDGFRYIFWKTVCVLCSTKYEEITKEGIVFEQGIVSYGFFTEFADDTLLAKLSK